MNRAQSEVVGLLFIFSITFVSISVILLTGFPILDNATENTQLERFQNEFSVLDQEIRESVYAPGQSGATISLSDRRVSIDDGSDSMAVEITYRPDGGTPVSTREINLGGVEFDARGDRGVAYEAGGIWSKYRGGGLSMRTPPDISYSGDTLNMNLMNFVTDVDVGGDSTRTFVFSSEGAYRSSELRSITDSSLESGELEISVRSHYADGWAEYFNRTNGVEYRGRGECAFIGRQRVRKRYSPYRTAALRCRVPFGEVRTTLFGKCHGLACRRYV
ncbi:MAG: hypothetical protein U5J64_06155 [Halobacteriales archaeon]|nr:hypothetical protein [Halobacteriales archaeon]